jgi:GTP pyrophosphokinase
MVKHTNQIENAQSWLTQLIQLRGEQEVSLIKSAMQWYAKENNPAYKKGLAIADILLSLALDTETLTAAFLYPALQQHEITLDDITDHFGVSCSKLVADAMQMQSLGKLQQTQQNKHYQVENLRKMLLAMVTDVRAVLIILAERLWTLRHAKDLLSNEQQALAQETLDLYAPLANRLGIWQLKWEIEDLCLRYLQPEAYTNIAKWLASRRTEREKYIEQMIQRITEVLRAGNVNHFQLSGRVKHIYSIHKKMQRKAADFSTIYDISAVRVLVDTVADCYMVLSLIHNEWQQIPAEFDDYIAQPKLNGYKSIHTVLVGEQHKPIEVQIRTYAMHQEAELGVASHWRYKEGILQTSNYEAKIALLRQVMAWHKDVADTNENTQSQQDIFADRIYVFTPTGDIMDLPTGATPLDFAYHIHSEVGNRCRGAKVDNKIVPLTYTLQTGQRIEILTAKQPNPSRDWLNPHHGYLTTARARAKLQHWFKVQDSSINITAGKELLEKEIKKMGYEEKIDLHAIAIKLNYKHAEDVLAALGAGDIRVAQIIHHLRPSTQLATSTPAHHREPETTPSVGKKIVGINSLLTKVALCCKPLPGDAVIGYITQNRGVSIHRRDCNNIKRVDEKNQPRFLEIEWDKKFTTAYSVDLHIRAYNRTGILRDITALLAGEKINVLGLQTQASQQSDIVSIYLSIEIMTIQQLNKAIELLQNIENIIDVIRR